MDGTSQPSPPPRSQRSRFSMSTLLGKMPGIRTARSVDEDEDEDNECN